MKLFKNLFRKIKSLELKWISKRLKKNDYLTLFYNNGKEEICFFYKLTDDGIIIHTTNQKNENETEYKLVLFDELELIINLLKN